MGDGSKEHESTCKRVDYPWCRFSLEFPALRSVLFLAFRNCLFRASSTANVQALHDKRLHSVFREFYAAWTRLIDIGPTEGKVTINPNLDRLRVEPNNRIETQEIIDEYGYWADESDVTFRKLLKFVHDKFPNFDFAQTNGYAWLQHREIVGE